MVNAGRILIIPKGEWSNLVSYEMLDLVSYNQVAYLARQASVGVNPANDQSMTYWQPFGSVSGIATTSEPGLVMPDGTTITVDATGLISANLGIADLNDIAFASLSDGQVLIWDAIASKWKNADIASDADDISYDNTTSGLQGSNVQDAIDEVSSQMQTLESDIDDLTASVSTKADQSLLAPIQTSLVASQPYAIGDQFVYNGLLYTVTAAISQGGTITIDGNCTLSSKVCAQIKQLKSLLKIKTKQVSFNSSGIGSISDSDIHSTDKILAVANTADRGYAVGVIIGLGNTSNGAVTLYAINQSGGAYTGNIYVNYLIFPAG